LPGCIQEAFDEALAAAEGGGGLADRGVEGLGDLVPVADHFDAAAAAAVGSLDGQRETVGVREGEDLVHTLHGICSAGNQGSADLFGDVPGLDFVAEFGDGIGGGTNPDQPGIDDPLGEVRVFGEEAVAGVDGVGTGGCGHFKQFVHGQIGLRGGAAAQGVCLVGQTDMQRIPVRLCVNGDGGEAFIPCGSDYADGNFTTVGDQYLGDALGHSKLLLSLRSLARFCGYHPITMSNVRVRARFFVGVLQNGDARSRVWCFFPSRRRDSTVTIIL
jgi:hypothetical protein